jgi:hypothetical protein
MEKIMSAPSEYDYIINSLVEEMDAYIDHKISWAISGTKVEELEHDYYCEAVSDIKYKLLTTLKNKL